VSDTLDCCADTNLQLFGETVAAMSDKYPLIFDGHNDVLTRILRAGSTNSAEKFLTGMDTQIDAPKSQAGGFGGGFFAIWVASPASSLNFEESMSSSEYHVPLPAPVDQQSALNVVMEEAAILFRLEALKALTICKTTADLRSCINNNQIAAIMHIEGAEAIDPSLHTLDVLYEAGLRSLGPVWSRPTIFAEGVPMKFPSTPDTGDGLTPVGVELVKRCNELGIMIDLSHLNEAGFWDVVRHSDAPIVATHSNAHSICRHSRNLTDNQLKAIADSKGMVGLNFATAFLREDGKMRDDVPLQLILRHLDHLISIAGEDCVGFGSDFDGAVVPREIGDASGLVKLRIAMREHGYNDALMHKLCHENWIRLLDLTWKQ